MFVARLRLVNFRSYHDATVEFAPGLNIIVGRNASGKTNLLEGAYFALRAASPRTTKEEKAVRWGATYTRAEATIEARGGRCPHPYGRLRAGAGQAGAGRRGRCRGARRPAPPGSVFIFVPEVCSWSKAAPPAGAPLDAFAAALEPAYDAGLRDLNIVLKQRNAHLWRVREGAPADSLDAWDRQLARVALAFSERRQHPGGRLAARYRQFAAALAPEGGDSRCPSSRNSTGSARPVHLRRALEEALVAALRARRPGEIGRAVSRVRTPPRRLRSPRSPGAIGRGDAAAPRDLRLFGRRASSGPRCSPCLLAERAVAADVTGDVGALLLDDVMSELDDATPPAAGGDAHRRRPGDRHHDEPAVLRSTTSWPGRE